MGATYLLELGGVQCGDMMAEDCMCGPGGVQSSLCIGCWAMLVGKSSVGGGVMLTIGLVETGGV